MARHDFNSPCDCRECREMSKHHICPACQFVHVVTIDRDSTIATDRKGFTYYDFTTPEGPGKSITCSCGYVLSVGYFTTYNHRVTQLLKEDRERKVAARTCTDCQNIEGFDRSPKQHSVIELEEFEGRNICQDCAASLIQAKTPDPSNENNKYEFDLRKREWTLHKIKRACVDCGKNRWLNANNQWKDKCKNCYVKSIPPSERLRKESRFWLK